MGLFARLSTTVTPARRQAQSWGPLDSRWYAPASWLGSLSQAGVRVSPDLAMTLSAVWRAVSGIVGDISTAPCQVFRFRDDGGKDRDRNHRLSYPLRWQPNRLQTAQNFFGMIVAHQLLRGNAYVELVMGRRGFADQMIPRHPDRIRKEHAPSGDPIYRLIGQGKDGQDRILMHDEMMHLPDVLTFDGWLGASRVEYGLQSMGGMLAVAKAQQSFFSRGMTAAVVATHKGGELSEEELKNLHASMAMYASGAENNGGILIIEEDMSIAHLGVDPDKAQLLPTAQEGIKHVARWFGYPGHKLEIDGGTAAYAAREQANLEYVGSLRPMFINLEQTLQKDLLKEDEKEEYFVEFLMDALFRGDLKSQAEYFAKAVQFGWMNRNEVRLRSNLNPAEGLDRYLEPENMRDADPKVAAKREAAEERRSGNDRRSADRPWGIGGRRSTDQAHEICKSRDRSVQSSVRASLLAYEAGQRVVRREKAAVLKAAEKYAKDGPGWSTWLREFYADHAGYVAATLHVPISEARDYAAEHGTLLEQQGVKAMEDWEHTVAAELAAWALEGQREAA